MILQKGATDSVGMLVCGSSLAKAGPGAANKSTYLLLIEERVVLVVVVGILGSQKMMKRDQRRLNRLSLPFQLD